MNMTEWAKREVEIACERERAADETKEGEFSYGCACYESALKAYDSLCEDGHSGFSIGITKLILNRLIDHKPLTPIEDREDEWSDIKDISGLRGEKENYQCKRYSSLFKYVYEDGRVEYSDNNRFVCEDVNDPENRWYNGFVARIVGEMFPITMPYMPTDKPYVIKCDELLTDPKNGDYDSMAIIYVIKPDGDRMAVQRYFKEECTDENRDWVEIDKNEWCERMKMDADRRLKAQLKESGLDKELGERSDGKSTEGEETNANQTEKD